MRQKAKEAKAETVAKAETAGAVSLVKKAKPEIKEPMAIPAQPAIPDVPIKVS